MDVVLSGVTRRKPKPKKIKGFGIETTAHMAVAEYHNGSWGDVLIKPYEELHLSPKAQVLDYGHSLFEGAKAFKHPDGELYTFRFEENAKRMNESAKFLLMPTIPEEIQKEAVHKLLDLDRYFYPENDDACFYIRPKLMGITPQTGISQGNKFLYSIILSPSGPYYSKPVRALIANSVKRVPAGGQGRAKIAANYPTNPRNVAIAGIFDAQQILYTDPHNEYIEEYGSMNHFHITRHDQIFIPKFTENILPSITARSVAQLAETIGLDVIRRDIHLNELLEGILSGLVTEAGGFGTAAVVSTVNHYTKIPDNIRGSDFDDFLAGLHVHIPQKEYSLRDNPTPWTQQLYDSYTNIQRGREKDIFGWSEQVKRYM